MGDSMKDNKKSSHLALWLIAAIIAVISYFMFMGVIKNGISVSNGNNDAKKGVKTYKSIDDMLHKTSLKLEIPEYIVKSNEELTIQSTYNQLISIYCNKFAFKASNFVGVAADPLGLYEDSKVDNKYSVNDTNITLFRYRTGYKDYPNSTLINWCTNDTMYGLMIGEEIKENDALKIVGISKEKISNYTDDNKEADNTEEDKSKYKQYNVTDTIKIKLPKFSGDVTTKDMGNCKAFYVDNNIFFIIVYDKDAIDNKLYKNSGSIKIDNNIELDYDKSNTFDHNTKAYDDYNLFLSTIDDICDTIIYEE